VLEGWIAALKRAVETDDRTAADLVFETAIPDYRNRPKCVPEPKSASATVPA
jgi:O-antigen biosynthesis protein WbqV